MLVLLTAFHVAASLIGILAGVLVVLGLLRSQIKPRTAAWFLGSTAAAVVSGFLFNPGRVTMGVIGLGQIDGFVSLIVLVWTWLALYRHRLEAHWRSIYAAGATALLYLNMVILVLQLFGKIAVLRALISGPSDPLFLTVQAALLAAFVLLGKIAIGRFRPARPIVLHPPSEAPFGRIYSIDELWRL